MRIASLYCPDGRPGGQYDQPLCEGSRCCHAAYFARRCENPSVFAQLRIYESVYRMCSDEHLSVPLENKTVFQDHSLEVGSQSICNQVRFPHSVVVGRYVLVLQ
jgi:hypothetical protein